MSIVMPNDIEIPEMVEAMKRLLKVSARMYMHLTKTTIKRFGREGEMTIRYGLRRYGQWRGMEMRQAHHAMGLEINMKNLVGCWDNASTYLVKDTMEAEGKYLPHDTRHDVPFCPAAEAWKDAEFHQWGHVYCDEFHQACASTYHPDGNVVIPQNLMKGDDHCHFRWVMPSNAETLTLGEPTELGRRLAADYQATTDVEAAWRSLRRSNRLVGGRYYTHASVILERHGDKGREAILEALTAWGLERGRILRSEHETEGIEINLINLFRHHDMPARFAWRCSSDLTPAGGVVEISETPHEEAWADLDAIELGGLWYEGSYAPMVEAYMPGTAATWIQLRSRGDLANRLQLSVPQHP